MGYFLIAFPNCTLFVPNLMDCVALFTQPKTRWAVYRQGFPLCTCPDRRPSASRGGLRFFPFRKYRLSGPALFWSLPRAAVDMPVFSALSAAPHLCFFFFPRGTRPPPSVETCVRISPFHFAGGASSWCGSPFIHSLFPRTQT